MLTDQGVIKTTSLLTRHYCLIICLADLHFHGECECGATVFTCRVTTNLASALVDYPLANG